MEIICAGSLTVLELGKRGSNQTRVIRFDIAEWMADYPDGSVHILHKRPGEETPLPVSNTEKTDTYIDWVIEQADVANEGYGECELVMMDTISHTAKSVTYMTHIGTPISSSDETVPEPHQGWVDSVLQAATDAEAAKNAAVDAQTAAETAQSAAEAAQTAAEKAQDTAENAKASAVMSSNAAYNYAADANRAKRDSVNAKNDAVQAKTDAENAQKAAENAEESANTSALKSEGYAVGTQNGTPAGSGEPYYQDNAKYYKEQAAAAKTAAETARDTAQQTVAGIEAAGTAQVGRVAAEGATQVTNVQTKGQQVLDSIPSDYSQLSGNVDELKSAFDDAATEIGMTVIKQEIPPDAPTAITQVVDLTNAANSGSGTDWEWRGFVLPIYWLGKYYMNPMGAGYSLYHAFPRNKNGELITLYRNGEAYTNAGLSIAANGYMEVVDKRTIRTYNGSGGLSWVWTTDEDIAYFSNKTGVSIKLGHATAQNTKIGITFLASSENYVEYEEITPEEPEYEYIYNDVMSNHVAEYIADNFTDDEPAEDSPNFVKSGGIIKSFLKKTYNLIDPEWFLWDSGSSYISLPLNMYLDASPGKVLLSNASKVHYDFYDANKAKISSDGSSVIYDPIVVPTGAVYFRPSINSAAYIPENHEVIIYYSDNDESPRDDIRPFILHNNLIGMRGSSEIFDYYAPNAIDKEILQMAKYSANRTMNYCNNVIRIGTFNMYVSRLTNGWETARKMFKDFAVDVVGFQEVSDNRGRVWTSFLKGWEFPYGVTDAPVAVASQFGIISHQTYTTSVTERKFIKTVIQLPRYADKIDPLLSIYNYHGIWDGGTYDKRAQEIADILAVMANDTSDFIIVLGDTNAPAPHSEWDLWRDAGYTPLNTGNLVTTINGGSLDNIFIPQNVSCRNVHIVPSRNYMITISGSDVPLSDHNMMFADLQFDFDSLLV